MIEITECDVENEGTTSDPIMWVNIAYNFGGQQYRAHAQYDCDNLAEILLFVAKIPTLPDDDIDHISAKARSALDYAEKALRIVATQ